jgi:hypothetical protein
MAASRQITCTIKRHKYFEPHERIESVGGIYLGHHWNMPDFLVIYHIQQNIEKYFVVVNGARVKVVVGIYNDHEYLKGEVDQYSPDTLLRLPHCTVLSGK